MRATEFVAYLQSGGYTVRGSGPWTAECPAHEDRSPSLSVTQADGRVLIHCHAGCTASDVLAALHLRWPDLFDGDRTAALRGGARTSTAAVRGGAKTTTSQRKSRLDDVNRILRAFEDTGLTWRCAASPDVWRAECPICRDPWLSVRVVDVARTEGREGEPVLVFCAHGCESSAIAGALRGARS